MSGLRGVLKDGWHPKGKEGGKESWRGDFKGINQVAGWMGKGKDRDSSAAEHVSRPLSSLKDPAAFGPPPRHINYHGSAAVPNQTTPDRRGLGAPLSQAQIQEQNALLQQQEAEAAEAESSSKPTPPPVPYRVDRTGLTTTNLPPPPVRRVNSPAGSTANTSNRPKPSVPPRVPPRTSPATLSPPPAYSTVATTAQSGSPSEGYINQDAAGRLAQQGVSVPGLGIGGGTGSGNGNRSSSAGHATPVNELRPRFAQISTTNASASTSMPVSPTQSARSPPATGTTWAEKQAALRTAHNAHKDPSSVSLTEARTATSTVNNFRERHNDQIQAGMRKVSGLNEKYGISTKIKNFANSTPSSGSTTPTATVAAAGGGPGRSLASPPPLPPPHPNRSTTTSSSSLCPAGVDIDALNQRKAPPPPPPKRQEIRGAPSLSPSAAPAPPPLPLGTKPR